MKHYTKPIINLIIQQQQDVLLASQQSTVIDGDYVENLLPDWITIE